MKFFRKGIFLLATIGIATGAFYNSGCNIVGGDINLDVTKPAFDRLSEYNLFKGTIAELTPNGTLLPYELITPLFSDYAEKARFVYMPKDKQATYTEDGVLDLPVGAVLVKNFYYPNDFRDPAKGRRIIETRLLIHRESGWDAETYVWNKEQTDANREIAGSQFPVSFINKDGKKFDINYAVPNKNQCGGCHELSGKITPIGPKARNLNKDYAYADGKKNQLVKWQDVGYLTGLKPIDKVPHVAKWDDPSAGTLDDRARGWLDVNCAHCHNPKGPAKNSGLDLSYTQHDLTAIGVKKYPVAAGDGAGDKEFDIDPGNPDNSILLYRLQSTESEVMMPELGRSVVHTESVDLIRQWIIAMKPVIQ
jgi:uncharacterized repeat protein (TIGR03806 family)